VLFVVTGVLGPWLAPQDPTELDLIGRLTPPGWQDDGSWAHPLGTDDLGRDVVSRLLHGARLSLFTVVVIIPISTVIGVAGGLIAAWFGGWVSRVVMATVDLQLAVPGILLAVLLASLYGPSLRNVVIVLVIFLWAGKARVVRGEAISLAQTDFVTAARTIGATDLGIMLRHILPNLLNTVVILATLDVSTVIIAEAGLSFLGVGVSQETISWGKMISEGRGVLSIAWWLVTIPGVAIILVALSGNLFGDWLRDALDPRLRHAR
jgi:peptide/nickel transport system permease protein